MEYWAPFKDASRRPGAGDRAKGGVARCQEGEEHGAGHRRRRRSKPGERGSRGDGDVPAGVPDWSRWNGNRSAGIRGDDDLPSAYLLPSSFSTSRAAKASMSSSDDPLQSWAPFPAAARPAPPERLQCFNTRHRARQSGQTDIKSVSWDRVRRVVVASTAAPTVLIEGSDAGARIDAYRQGRP